ncbi:MAG: VOC family protein [Spirochaetes bacterium]|nr:VOC family protein [Spirochaetota bacterium]
MRKIVPHLRFDKEAVEVAEFHASTFGASHVKSVTTIGDTPFGSWTW